MKLPENSNPQNWCSDPGQDCPCIWAKRHGFINVTVNALQCKNTNLSLGEFFPGKGGKMYQVLSGRKLNQLTYSAQFLESSLITRYIMIAATLYQVFTCAGHSAKYFTCSFSAHYHSPAGVRRYFPSTSEETRFRISSELRCKARSVLTSKPSFFFLLEYTYLTMCMTM